MLCSQIFSGHTHCYRANRIGEQPENCFGKSRGILRGDNESVDAVLKGTVISAQPTDAASGIRSVPRRKQRP